MYSIKSLILLAFIFIHSSLCFAQLKFQKSYEQTVREAAAKQIPIFISVDFSTVPNAPALINMYAPDPAVAEYYSANFVNYRTEQNSTEGVRIREKYGLTIFPSFLFVRSDGSLIMKSHQVPRDKDFFMKLGKEAKNRFDAKEGLSDYEKHYEKTILDRYSLADYISLRISSGIYDNHKLIERYVDFLTIGELNNYREVLFIHQAGPIAFGRAYTFAGSNRKLVDSIFTYEPLQDRIDINNRIIRNTLTEAISTKDRGMSGNLYSFVYNTWKTNSLEGEKYASYYQLEFTKGIKDTTAFYNQAQYFYDRHFMSVRPDSIKRMKTRIVSMRDSLTAMVKKFKNRKDTVNRLFSVMSVGTSDAGNIINTAFILNNAAWDFYTYGTRDPVLLNKAMLWSRRSIEIDPKATHYDTLAHLMYRLGWFDEALLNQEKAIRIAQEKKELNKEQVEGFRKEAQKMRDRSL